MTELVIVLGVLVALPGVLAAVHLTLLSVAGLFWRPPRHAAPPPPVRFLVLVPARNEERCLGDALAAIERWRRSDDLVLVVADHCEDDTAGVARRHGAHVLERTGTLPAGRAHARQHGIEYARRFEWDAVVCIDADSIVEEGFFDACERMLPHAEALQVRAEAALQGGLLARATTAALALRAVLVPRGRDRLGLAGRLGGTGMVLRRSLTNRYRLHAAASEDGILTLELCLDGIKPRHVDDARLRSRSATTVQSAASQRVRWEAGRFEAWPYLRHLIRCGSPSCLEMAVHAVSPPFALAVLLLGLGSGLALLGGAATIAAVLAALLALLALDLAAALVVTRADARTWLALVAAPWYVLWKVLVQVRAVASVVRRRTSYPPTPRG